MFKRPKDNEELQKREAIGVIRASRFIRRYANSHQPIDIKTIREIHKEIFDEAWPDIAGKYRIENLKITGSKHLPPHFKDVSGLMEECGKVLEEKLGKLGTEGILMGEIIEEASDYIEEVISIAAWIHHRITYIHPFREGNGRTARLAANLILERYGLVGISIKIEKENKDHYRQALAQIDSSYEDYERLKQLIYEGLIDRYEGVHIKYYDPKNKDK